LAVVGDRVLQFDRRLIQIAAGFQIGLQQGQQSLEQDNVVSTGLLDVGHALLVVIDLQGRDK
jgi:hypothetical protein